MTKENTLKKRFLPSNKQYINSCAIITPMENRIINKINLRPEEEIIQVVRRYFLTLWPNIGLSLLLILVPFFFLFPLFRLGYWGVIIFSFLILSGLFYGIRKIAIWYLNVFVITSKRVIDIDQRGFFDQIVSEVSHKKIKDVSCRIKGFWQTIFHYGKVRVKTSIDNLELEFSGVKNPEAVQDTILDEARLKEREENEDGEDIARDEDFSEEESYISDEEFESVEESVREMSEEQLEDIYKMTKNRLREIKLGDFDEIK